MGSSFLCSGVVFADTETRFAALDCHKADLVQRTPSACAHAFEMVTGPAHQTETLSEGRAAEVFAAELEISLVSFNRYSVILSKWDRDWQLTAFAGKPDDGYGEAGVFGRTFRSVHFDIPTARAETFKTTLRDQGLLGLKSPKAPITKTLETGEVVNIVCTDGASLSAKQYSKDYVGSAKRHNCRGRAKIDDFADLLFDLAVEFDPKLEAYRFTLQKDDP